MKKPLRRPDPLDAPIAAPLMSASQRHYLRMKLTDEQRYVLLHSLAAQHPAVFDDLIRQDYNYLLPHDAERKG